MTEPYKWRMGVAQGEDDWLEARAVFVKSFQKYPLYVHMEPDGSKRPEFLQKYLEANYDVAVRHGKGILMLLKYQESEMECERERKDAFDIRGAVLFVPPADDGIAWSLQDDNLYWEAYKKIDLASVSEGCLDRVVKYEAWEQEQVTKVLRKARVPMWNGLFCAIDPDLCLHGLGSLIFEKTVEIMIKYRTVDRKQDKNMIELSEIGDNNEPINGDIHSSNSIHLKPEEENLTESTDVGFFTRLWNSISSHSHDEERDKDLGSKETLSEKKNSNSNSSHGEYWMKFLHGLALLHHMPIPGPRAATRANIDPSKYCQKQTSESQKLRRQQQDMNHSTRSKPIIPNQHNNNYNGNDRPVIAAISHSSMTSHFYAKNGFRHVVQIPYRPGNSRDDPAPFNTHVLLMDPLKTGKVEMISGGFYKSDSEIEIPRSIQNIPLTTTLVTDNMASGEMKA